MKTSKTSAFTLIELLVVISIIAILASIAIPAFSSAQKQAAQNKALQQTKGIFYGLKMFATDHNGTFPAILEQDFNTSTNNTAAPTTANQAFANVVPTYVQSENPFSVASSKYCKISGGTTPVIPDNDFSSREKVLQQGENTFAYVMGLSDTSNANYPIIADGFDTPGGTVAAPKYSKDETAYGGVWGGRNAIVVRCDGSAAVLAVNQANLTILRPGSVGGNLFTPVTDPNNPWLTGCTVLDPL
jgi:prepilin-type N-terminal cleavage/methylation domain-containing protein